MKNLGDSHLDALFRSALADKAEALAPMAADSETMLERVSRALARRRTREVTALLLAAALVVGLTGAIAVAGSRPQPPVVLEPSIVPEPTVVSEPSPQRIAEGQLARFADPRNDFEAGTDGEGLVPDLRTVTIESAAGNLVFDLVFAKAWDDPTAGMYVVIADPDTVPPNGPPPGSRAPYCSAYEGPYLIVFGGVADRLDRINWETEETTMYPLWSRVEGRHVRFTIPRDTVTDIVRLGSGPPRLSFSISVHRDIENGEGFDFFPAGTHSSLNCKTVELAP